MGRNEDNICQTLGLFGSRPSVAPILLEIYVLLNTSMNYVNIDSTENKYFPQSLHDNLYY